VRGKVTLAVPTALALPQKSADRPKGRVALPEVGDLLVETGSSLRS